MTDFQALINNSIKNLRLASGMTQERFCDKCMISVDNYRNFEYNRHSPKSSTIDKICNAFNITPMELLRYGLEQPGDLEQITKSLCNMSEMQLAMIKDFITIVRKYELTSKE